MKTYRKINDKLPLSDKELKERKIEITKEIDIMGVQSIFSLNENQS